MHIAAKDVWAAERLGLPMNDPTPGTSEFAKIAAGPTTTTTTTGPGNAQATGNQQPVQPPVTSPAPPADAPKVKGAKK